MPQIISNLQDPLLVELLRQGKVGVIPTDTQYGLVADASNRAAVDRLYALKSRDDKPGTLIAASVDQLVNLGFKARYLKAVEQFWPNPISVVIPCGPELNYLHRGKSSLPVRLSKPKALLSLLEQTGPLATSSANHPGQTSAGTIQQAIDYFGANVDFYVDGGDLSGQPPSTIIRVLDDAIEVLREGAVKISETGEITNDI